MPKGHIHLVNHVCTWSILVKFLVTTGPVTTPVMSSTISLTIPIWVPTEEPENGETEDEEETKKVTQAVIIGAWTGGAIMSLLVICLGVRIIVRQQRLVSVILARSFTIIADTGFKMGITLTKDFCFSLSALAFSLLSGRSLPHSPRYPRIRPG